MVWHTCTQYLRNIIIKLSHAYHDSTMYETSPQMLRIDIRVFLRGCHSNIPYPPPGLVQRWVDRVHARVVGRHWVTVPHSNGGILRRGETVHWTATSMYDFYVVSAWHCTDCKFSISIGMAIVVLVQWFITTCIEPIRIIPWANQEHRMIAHALSKCNPPTHTLTWANCLLWVMSVVRLANGSRWGWRWLKMWPNHWKLLDRRTCMGVARSYTHNIICCQGGNNHSPYSTVRAI